MQESRHPIQADYLTPETTGIICSQNRDHLGGVCTCGPPTTSIRDNKGVVIAVEAKIDTRTGKVYGGRKP